MESRLKKKIDMQKLRKEYDNVDVDGFTAWAYIEHPIWFKRKYREYLNWTLGTYEEVKEQMEDCGLLYIANGESKRKCKECGKTKDWDEFVDDTTPLCVECAELQMDAPSGDETIPESYGDIY